MKYDIFYGKRKTNIGSFYLQDNLVDSLGFRYTLKVDKRRSGVTWRCSSRCAKAWCKATVLEKDGVLTRGPNEHTCGAEPGNRLNVGS